MFPILIIAGGKATRLFPLTQEIPKSMIEILGKPFIGWQLELLAAAGFKSVILCLGEKAAAIEEYVMDGSRFGLQVQYSFDGVVPLGTAGAIAKALPLLPENFGVMYGDSYLPINYCEVEEFYNSNGTTALMTIYRNKNLFDNSNVNFKEGKIIGYSKINRNKDMDFIDYGFAIMNKSKFLSIQHNRKIDLSELFENLVKGNELAGYEIKTRFYEIGSFSGLRDFESYLEGGRQ
jgi:MurNAc alpha-1-phosphate uridylyltransferase